MTDLEILRAARKYAEDPAHIVPEARMFWADADGKPVSRRDVATCGCLLGIVALVTPPPFVAAAAPSRRLSEASFGMGFATVDDVVREGQEAMLAVYDEAIRVEEARVTA